jgi:hypothetical protein
MAGTQIASPEPRTNHRAEACHQDSTAPSRPTRSLDIRSVSGRRRAEVRADDKVGEEGGTIATEAAEIEGGRAA